MKNQVIVNFTPGSPTEFDSVIILTKEQAIYLGIDPTQEEQRGKMETVGPWNIPISYTAVCMSAKFDSSGTFSKCVQKTIYGTRKISNVRSGGYTLDGWVSVNGKKYSCFTSSQLFEVDGKLLNVATIHARVK